MQTYEKYFKPPNICREKAIFFFLAIVFTRQQHGNELPPPVLSQHVRREKHVGGKVLTQKYYRLTESYRDSNGKTRQHMLLALGYLPELPTFEQRDMYMRCLNALVLRGEYIIKAIPKYLYTIPKHTISASQTVRFSLRNRPFCVLKRTVLEREKACISNPLKINVVQRWRNRRNNMNYLNNLLSV